MTVRGKRVFVLVSGIFIFGSMIVSAFPFTTAYAAGQITKRSLTLEAATDPGSMPAGVVNHLFTFTLPSTSLIKSIKFQYCTTADIDVGGTCTTPNGLVTTTATLGTQSGLAFDSVVNTTAGSPYVTSAAGVTPNGTTPTTIQLLGVTNPNNTNCGGVTPASNNCTFYVRITTYATTDTTGAATDAGTVAASTSTQITLNGTMPESLIFCTGGTISVNVNSIPDCTTATSGSITFNQLFSPTATATATSQLAASTNALSGYAITVSGPTLTSGTNTVPAIGATPAVSSIGSGQFGMNLNVNTTPAIGTAVTPAPNGTNFWGKPSTNFDTANSYTFNASGLNTIAASDNGTGTGHPTDSQIYTASYIVNVSGSQVAGTYTTTLTYICTPTF